MSQNKLVDKTRKVLEKQKELGTLIDDLKSEVKDVYYENQKLTEENLKLKEKLALFQRSSEPVKPQVEPVKEVVKERVVEKEPVKKAEPPKMPSPTIVVRKREKQPNPFVEFFLGKNIIAKIAAVLIFLGIITFGQMAYDWLPDLGRFLLIFFTGAFFFGIGIYFERKKAFVFSNVFYTIGLAIIYYSFMLARFGFELYSISVLSYLLALLMAFTLYFFKDKRYEFLDVSLFVFYFVAGLSIVFYLPITSVFSHYIEVVLFACLLGYAMYQYYTNYIKENVKLKMITQILLAIISIVATVGIMVLYDERAQLFAVVALLYSTLFVLTVYLMNYMNTKSSTSPIKYSLPIITTIVLLMMSIVYYSFLDEFFRAESGGTAVFVFIVLFAPVYAYLFKTKKEDDLFITNYYAIILASAMLIYSFVAGAINLYEPLDFYVLNLILVAEVLIFFTLSKFTKDDLQRYISYIFIGVLLLRNLNYYQTEGALLFTDSNVLFVTIGLGVVLFGINSFFRYMKQSEHQIDNVVVNGFNVLALVPFMMVFTNDLLSTDKAYIMAMVMVLLVGYRWLMELDIFRMFYKKHFILGMNISILLLTFALNLFYFDHDFSKFEDVFKFLFLFAVNVYIVYSLKEIFAGYCKTIYVERNFIILFGIGVTIHSFFIHNYINIEFDKVILSSYFLIASAVGVLAGFRQGWSVTRKIGLGAIYYSLAKFFIYDFYTQDFSSFVRMMTYFILGFILLGISFLYAYLERTYGTDVTE